MYSQKYEKQVVLTIETYYSDSEDLILDLKPDEENFGCIETCQVED